jgi:hypothetical protein
MADLTKGLLNLNLSPEQAMLLDRQAREQQIQQQTQATPAVFRGMLQQAMRTADTLQNVPRALMGEAPRRGAMEQQAIQSQQKAKDEEVKMQTLQDKLSGASVEKLASIYQNNVITNPKLAKAAVSILDMKKTLGGSSEDNIKSIQLLMNNKTVTAESGMKAIAAEKEEPGSGEALLVYVSEKAKKDAEDKMTAGDRVVYNKTLEDQTRLRTQNARSSSLITALKTVDKSSGVPAQIASAFKKITGTENSESVLNTMIESLRVEQAIGNLPPGVASDKDIALVMGGTLPSTANPEALIEWLSALQRLNQVAIDEQQSKLEWFDKKGSLQGYATHRKKVNQERAQERAKNAEEQARKESEELNARLEEKRRKVRELLQQQQSQKSNQEAFIDSTNIGDFL